MMEVVIGALCPGRKLQTNSKRSDYAIYFLNASPCKLNVESNLGKRFGLGNLKHLSYYTALTGASTAPRDLRCLALGACTGSLLVCLAVCLARAWGEPGNGRNFTGPTCTTVGLLRRVGRAVQCSAGRVPTAVLL